MNQVEEQKPPENPAKVTDSRFKEYSDRFGDKSWELDALKPDYLARLIQRNAERFIDKSAWKKREKEIEEVRARLTTLAEGFQ